MKTLYTDFLVIGSGPAGEKAAIQAAKLGKKVIVVEEQAHLGGASLNSGTIPSKSLREAIIDLKDFYKYSYYAKKSSAVDISINDLNYRLQKTLDNQRNLLQAHFKKNSVEVCFGRARFFSPYQVEVWNKEKCSVLIHADKILIASGSIPRNPSHVPFDGKKIFDSTRLLSIDALPRSMIVLGGGIIGAEYASFFAALCTKVYLVDKKSRMLPLIDSEIGMLLQKELTDLGLEFLGGKEFKAIQKSSKGVSVAFTDGQEIEADILLYALGRQAQVDQLAIQNAGIEVDEKGFIPVNSLFQTSLNHIYAVGDVIGAPALAATSMEQGRLAARNAFGAKSHHFPEFFPIGIYTIPEISYCGATEDALQRNKIAYEVGRAHYHEIARNEIAGSTPGMFKILFHKDTKEILGIHIVGRSATEIIHIGQIAMSFNARIDYFVDQVFNYPTYAEGYRIAALNGINKL